LSQEQALSKLGSKAAATPSAVSIVPGVPLSIGQHGVVHDIEPTSTATPPHRLFLGEAVVAPQPTSPVERSANQVRPTCSSPSIVYEWRSLSDADKQGFTAAMKCLFSKQARSGLAGTPNRWDDLAAIHQHTTPQIYDDGQFLPWHRYFMWILSRSSQHVRVPRRDGVVG
jgi:Common central domain of tyrosinase